MNIVLGAPKTNSFFSYLFVHTFHYINTSFVVKQMCRFKLFS